MRLLEAAVNELEQKARLADAGLADNDVLEDVSVADNTVAADTSCARGRLHFKENINL